MVLQKQWSYFNINIISQNSNKKQKGTSAIAKSVKYIKFINTNYGVYLNWFLLPANHNNITP